MTPPDDSRGCIDNKDTLPASRGRKRFPSWLGSLVCVVFTGMTVLLLAIASAGQTGTKRVIDASNLRQIGQASLIYANDHRDRFPVADDEWGYARILAEEKILNDAHFWVSQRDTANGFRELDITTVLSENGKELEPRFREAKLAWAVALNNIALGRVPSTTPIAWTRGLRPDGTWAQHSPYGSEGGHILFLGGYVQFYKNLNDGGGQLVRYDRNGMTGNILEALPPGTRIGEYVPSVEEERSWAHARRIQEIGFTIRQQVLPWIWLATLLLCLVQGLRGKWRWSVALWVLILVWLAFVIMRNESEGGGR